MSENVNFHMTFPPTPAYIGCLLKIADGRVRTVAEIAEETGIPEGASSGKVRPHIQYASYMGLLNSSDFTRTPLGKIVYLDADREINSDVMSCQYDLANGCSYVEIFVP